MLKKILLSFLLLGLFLTFGKEVFANCNPWGSTLVKGNCDSSVFNCSYIKEENGDNLASCASSSYYCCEVISFDPTSTAVYTRIYQSKATIPPNVKTTAGCDTCQWCQFQPKPASWDSCNKCVTGDDSATKPDPGVWTTLGCVHTKPENFVAQLLGWVMGIGGGLAFLLIVFGGFKVLTSGGDPEHLNEGKEIIVSALTGLLLIIFSVILLRIIGKDILQIPGFGK